MSLRRIDPGLLTPEPAPEGPRPELLWVPVAHLVIDESYQRGIERRGLANAQKIASMFSWQAFSPLLVARVDGGRFAVIDGQHRAHAAAACGIDAVPALVTDADRRAQARAFARVNGAVTALTPLQVYRAALAAREGWAVACDRLVRDAGCTLMAYNKSSKDKRPGEVFCVNTVRKAVKLGQGGALDLYLRALRGSSAGDRVAAYSGRMVKAFAAALHDLKLASVPQLVAFLDASPPDDIVRRVHDLQARPDYADRTFEQLFGQSLRALLVAHVQSGVS